jgi:cytochrome c oxidase subunit I+III
MKLKHAPDEIDHSQSPPLELQRAQEERLKRAWEVPKGWRYWSSVNNEIVGVWYTIAAFCFLIFGGALAMLIRVQLAVPNNTFLSANAYNQIFTTHGTVMMFLFAIPIFEAFSIMLLPQMLGARDLPFPRLSAFGFWVYVIGGTFFCGAIFFSAAPAGGWFMYPPLATKFLLGKGTDIWLLGLSFIEVAAIAAAVELIVGVLKCRPPGMRINLIPLYSWYMLVAAAMILFAFPPVVIGSLLMEIEKTFNWPFFDPTRGGDPLLWQHLFWLFGHPEVYIILLPSLALVAMILPTFARKPMVGYSWIVLAAIGIGFLSFGLWVHHMFTTGLPGISIGLFSAASEAVAIPSGVQIFCFIATLLVGRMKRSVPMLFIFGGITMFIMGGLTGVMVALAPFNFQAHDTFFIVAHLHYVLVGGSLFPVFAAVYYYCPLIVGKTLSERLGRIAFWLMFIGFNVTFLPQHHLGMRGMPRRVFTYQAGAGFDVLNFISTIGAFLLGVGFLVLLWDVLRPKGKEPKPKRNPWGGGTLEWLQEAGGPKWGMRSIPEIDSRYPLWEQPNFERDVEEGRFYLPDAEEGKRETLVSSVIDALPIQCLRLPGPTFITLFAALFTGGIFIFATFQWWWLTAISTVLALAAILVWLWTGTAFIPEKDEKDVGHGLKLPLYQSGPSSVGWWAMFITMLGDLTAFVSLVFAYFFFWTIHNDFPPKPAPGPGVFWPAVAGGLSLVAWVLVVLARRWNKRDWTFGTYGALIVGAVLAGGGAAALIAGPWTTALNPVSHVYPATVWVLVGWTALHIVLGVVMQLYCVARRAAGYLSARHDIDIWNVTLYWHFTAITVLITVAVIAGFPLVA